MIKLYPSSVPSVRATETDPYAERMDELRLMIPLKRIAAIEKDLEKVARLATTAATFHRKKLLRLHDATRLEAKLITPAQLQRENSFSNLDFSKAKLVFRPRLRQGA